MLTPGRVASSALLCGGLLACHAPDRRAAGESAAAALPDPDPAGAARARIGVVFEPLAVRPGDTVAGLVVTRTEVQRAAADATPVGTVAFGGELAVAGRLIAHADPDAAARAACFEADSGSAARLPRWAGDRRRAWFCFTNPARARAALGVPVENAPPVRIRIADLTIQRGLSDEVNSARFVRRLSP
jgi:hypothetical protein